MDRAVHLGQCAKASAASLFWDFLKIGCVAFGGHMAIVAMVERRLVDERKVLSRDDFMDLLALGNATPGPIAVNFASMAGYRCASLPGFWAAWLGLLAPAFVSCLSLKLLFDAIGPVPLVEAALHGFLVGILAVMATSVARLSRPCFASLVPAASWAFSFAAYLLDPLGNRILTLGALYGACLAWGLVERRGAGPTAPGAVFRRVRYAVSLAAPFAFAFAFLGKRFAFLGELGDMAANFALAGMTLFGGAYGFVPVVGELAVEQKGWVTMEGFLNAVAIGQMSPGPVLISSACIGWDGFGLAGAALATVGIFLPTAAIAAALGAKLFSFGRDGVLGAVLARLKPVVMGVVAASVAKAAFSSLNLSSWSSGPIEAGLLALGVLALLSGKANATLVLVISGAAYAAFAFLAPADWGSVFTS